MRRSNAKRQRPGACRPGTLHLVIGCLLVSQLLVSILAQTTTHAQTSPPLTTPPQELDLARAVTLAREENPLLEISRLEIDKARASAREATARIIGPRLSAESYSGLVPEARGDATDSPDTGEDYDDLGPFFKIDLTLVQPLYTFGKFSKASAAGAKYETAQQHRLQETENILVQEVITAFLGVIAGNQALEVSTQLVEKYQFLVAKIEQMLADEEPLVTDSDLLEARAMGYDIDKEVTKSGVALARSQTYLGKLLRIENHDLPPLTVVRPLDFEPVAGDLSRLNAYGRTHSPQLAALDAAIEALRHQAQLAKRMKLPDFFLAAGAGYGHADNRDKQENPFIVDQYNYERAGAVLGLKWEYNYFGDQAADAQAKIDTMRAIAKRRLAALRLETDISQQYSEAHRFWQLLQSVDKALRSSRSWIRLESDNMDVGLGDVKTLIDAYRKYFQLQAEQIKTRHDYLLALVKLAKNLGNTELFLTWERHGTVNLPN